MSDQPASIDPFMRACLQHMLKIDASDLYLTADSPPVFRCAGEGLAGTTSLDAAAVARMAASVMTPAQRDEFARSLEMNLALAVDAGRFRVNVFRQRGATGVVVRLVRTEIKSLDDLMMPPVLRDVVMSKRGLVLLVGGTGSGKSTTLAAMVDHRNATKTGHIVTVEDPIEFIHPHKKCVVTQREVGLDTRSYADALKNTLRQAPDVILIGEVRDAETMEAAMAFAETGHLCLSTLHANNANQAVERILGFFPAERQQEIRMQLSLNLRAVISQRLVRGVHGGRAAALEILVDTPRIKDLIKRGETDVLKDAMEQSTGEGCQTFDSALLALFASGRIGRDEALAAADSPNNLRLKMERVRRGAAPLELRLRLKPEPAPGSAQTSWAASVGPTGAAAGPVPSAAPSAASGPRSAVRVAR